MIGSTSRTAPGEVTRLLQELRNGSLTAFDELLPLVYAELRLIARRERRRRPNGGTLRTTELLHEAYIKLARQPSLDWEGRAHFYGVAARAMRQVLVDWARKRQSAKRRGGDGGSTLRAVPAVFDTPVEDLIAIDQALDRLGGLSDRLRRVVELRFFGGLEETEIAAILGVSVRSVERDWVKARLFLHRELYPDGKR